MPLVVRLFSSTAVVLVLNLTIAPAAVSLVEFGSSMRYRADLSGDDLVLVEFGSSMMYLANTTEPGIGLTWTEPVFDPVAAGWTAGTYGVGYEANPPGAQALLQTTVPSTTFSVFTLASFEIDMASDVATLRLGVDYDDGYVAWINGVEVFRSAEMPPGGILWDTNAALHESSNGATPNFSPIQDISTTGIPALENGTNVLAIGVWNSGAPTSSDLVLVPRLSASLVTGIDWTALDFDDSGWTDGFYGAGYETNLPGAVTLIPTTVAPGTSSIYTRAEFDIADPPAVQNLYLGADYDDGYVAWINGEEVFRSPEMPPGELVWDTSAASHESSNGLVPDYQPLHDISIVGMPVLLPGRNVLAVAVWNRDASVSSDLVLVPSLTMNRSTDVTRGPYLQMGTPTGVVVRWRTAEATDSRVWYGTVEGALTMVADEPEVTTEHVVSLTGLLEGTQYYYSVGSTTTTQAGGDADHFFVTSPVAGTAERFRIWVLGDSGTANTNAQAVRNAYTLFTGGARTDLWLMLGDNAYTSGTDAQYQAAVFDMYPEMLRNSVLWPTIGNHDALSANSLTGSGVYYDIFTLPKYGEVGGVASDTEAYYSFDYGNVHFVCLESDQTDPTFRADMLTWLAQDLAATNQDWTIAYFHHAPYSKGSHNSDGEARLIWMRVNVVPLLEEGGVDLVFSGHSHSYERSFLLDGHYGASGSLLPTMILDGGDGRIGGEGAHRKPLLGPDPHEGAVYVVAGSSGLTSGGTLDHPAMYFSLNGLGSVVLEVDGQQLDALFLDDVGAVRDYFTIFKGPGTPPDADFTVVPRSGPEPLTVSFADASTEDPSAWAWDFEHDGTSDSTEQDPVHTYTAAGIYTVELTAFNAPGSDVEVKNSFLCVTSATGLGDVDGDGANDAGDNCQCVANTDQTDTEGDGLGDACDADDDNDGALDPTDCAPLDGTAFDLPVEVVVQDVTGVSPTSVVYDVQNIGSGTHYEVISGLISRVLAGRDFQEDFCLIPSTSGGSFADTRPPPLVGDAWFYLMRSVNACGLGTFGSVLADAQGAGDVCPSVVDQDFDGSPSDLDCDDNDPDVSPLLVDVCNGVDDNCNSETDEGFASVPTSCGVGACTGNAGVTSCVAGSVQDSCDPLAGAMTEACNGVDDSCDGQVDEGFADTDGDSQADCVDADDDNDGVADNADCAPLDGAVSEIPAGIGPSLMLGPGPEQINWAPISQASVFHVYRGTLHVAPFDYDHGCFEVASPDTSAVDSETPLLHRAFYYLVSAANTCGEGHLGADSDSDPRPNDSPCSWSPSAQGQSTTGSRSVPGH